MPKESQKNQPLSVSIIVPAYNEERNVGKVMEDLLAYIGRHPETTWEVLVVDDCSTDNTAAVLEKNEHITLLRHVQNRGYGASLKTGIRAAKGEFVLMFDSDGQHIAEEIGNFTHDCRPYDLTAGMRLQNTSPPERVVGKWLLNKLVGLILRVPLADSNCGMRLFRRSAIMPYLTLCSNRFSFSLSSTMAMMSESHFVRFIPIETRRRADHLSEVRLMTGVRALLMAIRIGLVFHPLRILMPIAGVVAFVWGVSFAMDVFQENISKSTLLLSIVLSHIIFIAFLADQVSHVRRELKQTLADKSLNDGRS